MKLIHLIITILFTIFTFTSCEQKHHFPALNNKQSVKRNILKETNLPDTNKIKLENLVHNFNLNKNYIDIFEYEIINENGQIDTSKLYSFRKKPVRKKIENFTFSFKFQNTHYTNFKNNNKTKIKINLLIFSETSEEFLILDSHTYKK